MKVRPSRVPAVSVPVGEPGSSWWHRDVGDVPQLAARPQDGLVKNVSAEMAGTASRGAAWGKDAPADGETALGSVPDDGLSRGRPLDSTVRAYMEPRFGRDFSQVRMHTGPAAQASAGAQGALAYTCGPHVIFGSGQYRPETLAGRWLIAHELTHVIQQQGPATGGGATQALERTAADAGVRVALGGRVRVAGEPAAPPVQFALGDHGFTKALEAFAKQWNETKALGILRAQSPTFRSIMNSLDAHYVYLDDPDLDEKPAKGSKLPSGKSLLNVDSDGRVVAPAALQGKRVIEVSYGASKFSPFAAPENPIGADLISLQVTDVGPVGSFIQSIAHEATHARAYATSGRKAPASLVDAIAAGIADEIAARASEAKILSEIKDPAARKQFQPVASRRERDAQRDVSPAVNLTYLENSYFGWKLQQAQTREGESDEYARQIRDSIDKDHPTAPPPVLQGNRLVYDYSRIWFERQAAVRHWIEFAKNHHPDDPDFVAEREKVLQANAKEFFRGEVSYLP